MTIYCRKHGGIWRIRLGRICLQFSLAKSSQATVARKAKFRRGSVASKAYFLICDDRFGATMANLAITPRRAEYL